MHTETAYVNFKEINKGCCLQRRDCSNEWTFVITSQKIPFGALTRNCGYSTMAFSILLALLLTLPHVSGSQEGLQSTLGRIAQLCSEYSLL